MLMIGAGNPCGAGVARLAGGASLPMSGHAKLSPSRNGRPIIGDGLRPLAIANGAGSIAAPGRPEQPPRDRQHRARGCCGAARVPLTLLATPAEAWRPSAPGWRSTVTLPSPVLDHVVIDVRDQIDDAMRCFPALGFLLTPRGHHTLGSVNHLAMFDTDYLELLGFGEGGATRMEIARFPAGLNGLVFKTADAD